jgi:YVTN family beta-propeller protein
MRRLILLPAFLLLLGSDAPRSHTRERRVLVVANRGGSISSLIDAHTLTLIRTVGVGVSPHEAVIASDGRTAFVSNYGASAPGNSLSVIDVPTGAETGRVSLGSFTRPHGLGYGGGKVFVTSETQQAVVRYDPATGGIDWVGRTGAVGSHMLAVRADGSEVFTGNLVSGSVSAIRVSGAESNAHAVVSTVADAEAIALSPDETEVWSGSRSGGGIAIVDTRTMTVTAHIAPGQSPYRIAFSADGRYAFASVGAEVVIFDALTRAELRRVLMPGAAFTVFSNPESDRIWVTTGNPNAIVSVSLQTFAIDDTLELGPTPDGIALALFDAEAPHRKRGAIRR